MTNAQRIRLRLSQVRQRLNEIAGLEGEDFTDEIRSEAETLQTEYADLETRHQAAIVAEDEGETREAAPDAEMRERIELRSRASLGNYLVAALRGRRVDGAEAELQTAAGIGDGIPLELWDVPTETREDAATGAPGSVGVNLDRIRPAVFANSVAPRLGIEMPRVASGTYASATITTSLTAGSKAKGEAQESTPAAFTVSSVTPKRISARLGIRIEDVAAVGQANFEAVLRENLSLVLSDELDDQAINGAGGNAGADLKGIFNALTDPNAPGAGVAKFDDFVNAYAGGIDGLWASRMNEVAIVCGPETYRLSAKAFRDVGSNTGHRGDIAFADYAMKHTAGWWTNKRMPNKANHIQQAILHRKGRTGLRTAVCPHWNEISIDDIYSGSARGERYFTMHVLLGDVILVQPSAYAQVAFRVST